jgi:hypothetical protein
MQVVGVPVTRHSTGVLTGVPAASLRVCHPTHAGNLPVPNLNVVYSLTGSSLRNSLAL